MPFAGDMKLKNFLIIAGGTGLLALTGMAIGGKALWDRLPDPPPEPEPVVATPDPEPVAHPEPMADPQPAADPEPTAAPDPGPTVPWTAEEPYQDVIFAAFVQDLGTSKKKDVTRGQPYKVNLYQDDGHDTANRAKVDLDRDDQWDQKYTLKDDGTVSMKWAPDDDENYTERREWTPSAQAADDEVVDEDGSEEAASDAPSADAGGSMHPVDLVIFSYVGRDLGTNKLKDVTKGKPFKVNVYQDDEFDTANRAKIDLDRDHKWDEKLTFGDPISKKVSPNDDEDYTERYFWSNGRGWVKDQ